MLLSFFRMRLRSGSSSASKFIPFICTKQNKLPQDKDKTDQDEAIARPGQTRGERSRPADKTREDKKKQNKRREGE